MLRGIQIPAPLRAFPAGVRCLPGGLLCTLMLHSAQAQTPPPASLSLPAVLERVIATDRTVAVADLEVRKAIVEKLRPWTRVSPNLSLNADSRWQGSATRSETSTPASTATLSTPATGTPSITELVRERRWVRSTSDNQSLGLNLSQPIMDLTVRPARRQSELLVEISRWQLRQRLREVLYDVTAQYIEVLRQNQLVEENKKTLGQTAEQVRQAEGRLAAQEVIESDVLQARVSHEQANRAVMEAEVSRDLALSRLAVTLDYVPSTSYQLTTAPAGIMSAATLDKAISHARQNREEVRVAELTLNRTQAERDEIRARFAPSMDLQFGADLATGSTLDRRDSWSAGVSFTWPIFDRGQRALDLKTNRIQETQDFLRVENAFKTVSSDVLDSWFSIERFRKRLASLAIERQAAEANYEVQQGKYKAGLATALEVQTALRDLARVRIEHASTTFSLELAYRDLATVTALYENPRIDSAVQRLMTPLTSPVLPSSK